MNEQSEIVVLGAGPAGLTAAYLLAKEGKTVTVLEADPDYVGGISRTTRYKGYGFDIGGHRFFSKSAEVENFWSEILESEMLDRPRLSRILYRGNFYSYPLKAFDALQKLGIFEATRCVLSYFKARLTPVKNPRSFEDWVVNQFGRRLFEIFFKTYTEKVWGMSCKEISADWAAQRIKGLSLGSAIFNAIKPKGFLTSRKKVIKTLIESFRYPRLGPGMMWEAVAERFTKAGGKLLMGAHGEAYSFNSATQQWTVTYSQHGSKKQITCQHVISTAPMNELITSISPQPKSAKEAKMLRYRDFLIVALILKARRELDDNWIYIHEPEVKVGRIQNFKSWSPALVPDPNTVCYGMEYFCFENDNLWSQDDKKLVEFAFDELCQLGLAQKGDLLDAKVVRQLKAYPVYDDHYKGQVEAIRNDIETNYPGLHFCGRNGMHKYNNQDHAMMTAMLTAKNILAGEKLYDVWNVNQDAEYHEEVASSPTSGERLVPGRIAAN